MGIVKFYLDLNVTGSSTALPSIPTLDERPTFFSSDNVILEINLTESQARIFQFKSKNDTTDWDDNANNDLMFRYTPVDNTDYEHNINTDRPKNWPVFLNHWHNWQDKKHQKLHTASERLDKALANRIAYKVFNAPVAYDIFDNERIVANKCGMAVNNALKQIREKISSGYTALGNASGSDRGTHDNIFSANFSSVDQEGQDNDNNIPEYLLSRILKSEPLRVNKTNLLNPSTLNSNYGAVSCMDATEKYSEWTDVPLCAGDEIFINMNAKVTFTNPLTNASIDIDTTLANNANTSYIQPDSNLADASANKAVIKINIVKNDANDTANHAKISDFDLKDNEDDFNGHSSTTYYKEGDSSYVGPYSSVPENPTDASGNKMVFRTQRAAEQYTDATGSNNGVDTTEVTITGSTYHAPNAYTAAKFDSYEHLDNIGALDEEKPTFGTLTFQGLAAEHTDYNGADNVNTTALINVANNSVNFNIVFAEPLDPNTQFKDIFYVGDDSKVVIADDVNGKGLFDNNIYTTDDLANVTAMTGLRDVEDDNGTLKPNGISNGGSGSRIMFNSQSSVKPSDIKSLSFFVKPGDTALGYVLSVPTANYGELFWDGTKFEYYFNDVFNKIIINDINETFSINNKLVGGGPGNGALQQHNLLPFSHDKWYHIYVEINNPSVHTKLVLFNREANLNSCNVEMRMDKLFLFERALNDTEIEALAAGKVVAGAGESASAQLSSLIGGNSTIHSEVSSDGGITWTGTITPANDTTIIDQAIVIRNFQDLAGNVGDDIESTAKITIDTASPYATLAVVDGYENDLLTHNGMSLYNIINKTYTYIKYSMHNIEQNAQAQLTFTLYEKVNDNWVSRGTNTTNTNSSTSATDYYYLIFTNMQFDSSVSALVNDTDDTEWKLTVDATDEPGRNQLVTTNGNKEFIFKTDFTEPGIHTNTFESILKEFGGVKYLNTATSSSFSYNVQSNSSDLNFSECKVEIKSGTDIAYTYQLTTSPETIDESKLNLNGLVNGASYTHTVTYTDNAGNVTEQVSNTFYVDTTSATITGVALAEVSNQLFNKIQVTFSDTLDNATVNASDFDITNDALSNYSVSSVAHTPGTNSLVLTIDKNVTTDCTISYTSGGLTDKAGNPTANQTINLQTDTFNHTGITLDDNNHQLTIPVLNAGHEIKLVGNDGDDTFQALDNFTINYTLANDDTGTLNATQISRNGARNELKLQLPSTVSNNGTHNVNSADIKQLDIDFSALAGINRVLKNNTDGQDNQVTDVIQIVVSDSTKPKVVVSAQTGDMGPVKTHEMSITITNITATYNFKINLTENIGYSANIKDDIGVIYAGDVELTYNGQHLTLHNSWNTPTVEHYHWLGNIVQFTGVAFNDNTVPTFTLKFEKGNGLYAIQTFDIDYDNQTITAQAPIPVSPIITGTTTNDDSITLVFEITEANNHGFELNDITLEIDGVVANASQYISVPALQSSTDTVDVYHATLSKGAATVTNNAVEFSVSVAANAFTDDDSNGNEASNDFEWTCNQIRPAITITSSVPSGSHTNGNTLNLTFTVDFKGETNNLGDTLAVGDITVSNAVVDTFNKSSDTVYTAVLKNPSAVDGTSTAAVSINENVANDLYGNTNVASASFEWNCDQVNPTITVESSIDNATPVNTSQVTLTFTTEPRVGATFTTDDVIVTNGSVGSFSARTGGDLGKYDVVINANQDLNNQVTCEVKIEANSIEDSAGNKNLSDTIYTFDVDQIKPTVSNVTIAESTNTYLKEGETLNITVDFSPDIANKVLNITGSPTLELSLDNGVTRNATFASASSNGMNAVFEYTVQSGDNTSQLNYANVDSLKLSGGTIKDNYGNDAVLTLPATNSASNDLNTKTVVVDTTNPAQGSISLLGDVSNDQINNTTKSSSQTVQLTGFTDANASANVQLKLNNGTAVDVPITDGAGTYTLTSAVLQALSDGNHTIAVNHTDKAGNSMTEVSHSFSSDYINPALTIVSQVQSDGNDGFTNNQTAPTIVVICNKDATISATNTGPDTVQLSEDTVSDTNLPITLTKAGGGNLAAGSYVVDLTVTDSHSNTSTTQLSFKIITASPTISSVELSWGDVLNSQECVDPSLSAAFVKVTVADPLGALNGTIPVLDLCGNTQANNKSMATISTDEDSNETSQSTGDAVKEFITEISGSTGNTYKVTVTVTDKAGNSSSQDKTFTVDAQAPTLNVPATPIKTNANNTISFNVSASEAGTLSVSTSGYQVSAGADYTSGEHSVTVQTDPVSGNFPTGSNTIDLVLTDAAGNQTTQQVEIDVSRTAPTVTSPTDNTVFTNGVLTLANITGGHTINATLSSANADGKNATLDISGETINSDSAISGASVSFTVSETILSGISETSAAETHTLTITPDEDNYGNAGQAKDITFTVDKTAPSFLISSISWGTGANEIMIPDDLTTNDTVITFNNIVSTDATDIIEFMTDTPNLIEDGLGDAYGEVSKQIPDGASTTTLTLDHNQFNNDFADSQVVFKFRGKDAHGHTSGEISKTYSFDNTTTDIKALVATDTTLYGNANRTTTITIEVDDGDELVENLSLSDINVSTTSYGNINNFQIVENENYKKYTIDFVAIENVSDETVTVSVPAKAIRKKIRENSSGVRQGNLSQSTARSIDLHIDSVGPAPVSAVVDASGYGVSITFDDALYDLGSAGSGAMVYPTDFVISTLVNGIASTVDVDDQINLVYSNDDKTVLVTLMSGHELTNDMSNVTIKYMATTAVAAGRQPLRDVNGNHVENTPKTVDVTAAPAPGAGTPTVTHIISFQPTGPEISFYYNGGWLFQVGLTTESGLDWPDNGRTYPNVGEVNGNQGIVLTYNGATMVLDNALPNYGDPGTGGYAFQYPENGSDGYNRWEFWKLNFDDNTVPTFTLTFNKESESGDKILYATRTFNIDYTNKIITAQ